MNEITIPYHLAIPSGICLLLLLWIIIKRKRLFSSGKSKLNWISFTVFLSLYLLIVGTATYNDIYYQWDLNSYDLDGDGFFGGNEITEDQEAAMFRLTNDVGRNFSFITGIILSGMIAVGVFVIGKINRMLGSSKK